MAVEIEGVGAEGFFEPEDVIRFKYIFNSMLFMNSIK